MNVYRLPPPHARGPAYKLRGEGANLYEARHSLWLRMREDAREFGADFREAPPIPMPGRPASIPE